MISYSYEVIAVNEEARVMEVVYTSAGRQTMHIGARLPYEGESLQAVIESYAPVAYWLEQERALGTVQVGFSGSFTPSDMDMSLPAVKARKLAEFSQKRFMQECQGITFAGMFIDTNRQAQAAIASAQAAQVAGLVTSVDWKTQNGQWLTLGPSELTALIQAVQVHVQNSFALERRLADMVNAATTVEAVEAITWPE